MPNIIYNEYKPGHVTTLHHVRDNIVIILFLCDTTMYIQTMIQTSWIIHVLVKFQLTMIVNKCECIHS